MNRMRKIVFVLLTLGLPVGLIADQTMVISGVYQGTDLYVQNPFSGQGVSFCVFEVRVNGDVTSDEVNSSAFAIDFEVLGLSVGDEVEVVINHKDGCAPRVLNPEALNPRSTFEIVSIQIDEQMVLAWSTTNEAGVLPYFVEQFRWNKWVKAGEVSGEGTPGEHDYQFKITPHSGLNKVRVRQADYRGESRTSEPIEFVGFVQPVTFEPDKPKDVITFSSATSYEVFDRFGRLVKKGYDRKVDVANLEKGEYYLNYDSSFGGTFKKR